MVFQDMYDSNGTIKITYYISDVVFKIITILTLHGQQFTGDTHYAYLPNSPEGEECRLYILQKAFDSKLIFTICTSMSDPQPFQIHHVANQV